MQVWLLRTTPEVCRERRTKRDYYKDAVHPPKIQPHANSSTRWLWLACPARDR